MAGQTEKAVELLDDANFAYREGASRARNIRINANLMQELGELQKATANLNKALEFSRSNLWAQAER